jgi:hypothetical protein
MLGQVARRMIGSRIGRRLLMLTAGLFLLGAIFGSSAATPRASAQACCWPWQLQYTGLGGWWGSGGLGNNWWGNGSWGNNSWGSWPGTNWWGYNNYAPFSYGYGYSGYGTSLAYQSPYTYGYSYLLPQQYAAATPLQATQPVQQYQFPPSIEGTYLGYQTYSIAGQYCRDKSGGMVWVNTGAIQDGVTC